MKKFVLLITLLLAVFTLSACTDQPSGDPDPDNEGLELTLEELAEFDGKDGQKAYVAVDGVIYDVTDEWNNGMHNGVTAGTDASAVINGAPHGKGILDGLEVVGTLVEEQVDTEAPVLTIDPDKSFEEGSQEPNWAGFAESNEGTITVDDSMVDMNTVGTFDVTYTATDEAGNTSTGTLTVTITAAPEPLELTLEQLAMYNGQGGQKAYVAVDGVIYDVTNEWSNGMHNGIEAGTDVTQAIMSAPHGEGILSGLEVVGTIVENDPVVDTTPPVLTLDDDKSFEQGTTAPDWTTFASTNEGTITIDTMNVDMDTVGTFDVEYTATDEAGNVTTLTLEVTITLPQFTLAELAMYDGQDGSAAYIAVNGLVYDVTDEWNNGMHNGQTAGQDLSTVINSAPHGTSVLAGLEIVGELVDE